MQSVINAVEISVINILTENQEKDLLGLYQNEWWTKNRTAEDIKIILKNSSLLFGLVDAKTNKLIGFARVLTDYFKFAYICDVIVHPEYRKIKVGKK